MLDDSSLEEIQRIALFLASDAKLRDLGRFYARYSQILSDCILNILLYVPEIVNAADFAKLIKVVTQQDPSVPAIEAHGGQQSTSSIDEIATDVMTESRPGVPVRSIQLQTYNLETFIEARIRQIDRMTGLSDVALQLLQEFPLQCAAWRKGVVGPLSILQSSGNVKIGLKEFERLDISSAVEFLWHPESSDDLEQIFADVLLPWAIYKQNIDQVCSRISLLLSQPQHVSLRGALRIISVVLQSDLSIGNKHQIASGAMLACYRTAMRSDEEEYYAEMQTIVALLVNSFKPSDQGEKELPSLDGLATYDQFLEYLTSATSPYHYYVEPCQRSLSTLQNFVDASFSFGSLSTIIRVHLSDANTQAQVLQELLRVDRSDAEAIQFRHILLSQNILNKLNPESVDYSYLKQLLLSGKVEAAKTTYVTTSPRPLKSKLVEQAILEAFDERLSGLVTAKRKDLLALQQVLGVVHPRHSNESIRRSQLLVDSLVELSLYQGSDYLRPGQTTALDKQGVTDLFSLILQSRGNYKKHFRLLGLYQNLSLSLQIQVDENQFRELVINAALSFDDVDFAMKLVEETDSFLIDHNSREDQERTQNSTWRLVYQVCKYPADSVDVVRKQLDLLSTALNMCPEENIFELVLLHEKLEKSSAVLEQEEDAWELEDEAPTHQSSSNSTGVPTLRHHDSTTSSSGTKNAKIEMPHWRLFEAAQAATRTAREFLPRTDSNGEPVEGKIRKRDQIAGLVGSGVGVVESKFTSGLGWICKNTPMQRKPLFQFADSCIVGADS